MQWIRSKDPTGRLRSMMSVSILVFCASVQADLKPSESDWEQAFIEEMPRYFMVTEFNIESSQNLGNEIEPLWGVRYKALLSATENLYENESTENDVTFVRLTTTSGSEKPVFGRIYSKLFQGKLRYEVEVDEKVVSTLGIPKRQFEGRRIIVLGSSEEKEYNAEKTTDPARNNLVQDKRKAERQQKDMIASALHQYVPIITQKVSRNWNRPTDVRRGITASVEIRLMPNGDVVSAQLIRSSGNPLFDRSIVNAVYKASPLPIPHARGVNERFRDLVLNFRSEDLL